MLPKSKVLAIALLIAIAAVGFAAGAVASGWWHRTHRPSPRGRDGYAGFLTQQLGLDSTQADSVRAILQRYRPAMRQVFEQVRPQMDSLRDRMRTDIGTVLTAPQRQRYDSLLQRERAMRERGAPEPPPAPR